MNFDILSVIQSLSSSKILWIIVGVGTFLSIYYLWRGLKNNKNKEYFRTEHVFDFVIFSVIFGIIFARLSYIFLHWSSFAEVRWFWIPYEKVENQILWLQTFPWIFFRMNIETIVLDGLVAGFVIGINFVRRLHHLSWKKVSVALADYVGLVTAFGCWIAYIYSKQEILVYPVLVLFILFLIKELTRESFDIFKKFTIGIWKFVSVFSILILLTIKNLKIGFCCMLSWDILIFAVAVILILIFLIRITYRKKKVVVKENMRFEKKRIPTRFQKRSYTLSYKTLSGKWWNRLISRFHSSDENTPNNQ